jgi:hypothetical protein
MKQEADMKMIPKMNTDNLSLSVDTKNTYTRCGHRLVSVCILFVTLVASAGLVTDQFDLEKEVKPLQAYNSILSLSGPLVVCIGDEMGDKISCRPSGVLLPVYQANLVQMYRLGWKIEFISYNPKKDHWVFILKNIGR